MPKLSISTAKKSKLSASKNQPPSAKGIIDLPKEAQKPTSVRFTLIEKQLLSETRNKLNQHTKRKVSESDVIRALVAIGSQATIEDILKAYKDNM